MDVYVIPTATGWTIELPGGELAPLPLTTDATFDQAVAYADDLGYLADGWPTREALLRDAPDLYHATA